MKIRRFDRLDARRVGVLLASVVLCSVGHAVAPSDPKGGERGRQWVVDSWFERLREIDGELKAAEWKKAKRGTDSLLEEMRDLIEGGPNSGRLLAMTSLFRAIAEAGLGDERDAAWDFRMAVALRPELVDVDLAGYGEAASRLEPHRRPKALPMSGSLLLQQSPDLEPPKRRPASKLSFPFAKVKACVSATVVIVLVIDKEGLLRDPAIVSAGDPVLAFAAMDAIRDWTFRPARLAGKPFDSYFTQTVNYEAGECDKHFGRMDE